MNEKVGPPRALAEGRAPEVRRRGLSPNARGSGPARQVQARGSRDPNARVRAHRARVFLGNHSRGWAMVQGTLSSALFSRRNVFCFPLV